MRAACDGLLGHIHRILKNSDIIVFFIALLLYNEAWRERKVFIGGIDFLKIGGQMEFPLSCVATRDRERT